MKLRCARALCALPDDCDTQSLLHNAWGGQGPKVKVRLSIEPSHGGGDRWACRQPIEPSRVLDSQSLALLYVPTYGRRDLIVLMLNRDGTRETKVNNVIIVLRSVQVARRLTDFSIPVLTGFQGRALKLAPQCCFLRL